MASAAVDLVIIKLGQLATSEAKFLLGLEDEIENIKIKLEWLSTFLAETDQKKRHPEHRMVGVWVTQLRKIAYKLEDVLDEHAAKLDLQRMGYSGWRASLWHHCCISPKTQCCTRHDLASQICKIKVILEEIASNKAMFYDPTILSSSSSQISSTDIRINNLRNEVEEEPIGQDRYVEHLIPQLLNCNGQRKAIIPLFGMGGLGKTTLAKRLYNDNRVVSHFIHRAWLTISQTFSPIPLLRSLLKQLKFKEDDTVNMNEEEMKEKINGHLSKKSFIIVLDDIWEISSWEYLQSIFPKEHKGITVLLTTRKKNIATYANPDIEPFELQPLDHKESWRLFCKKAFSDANCPVDFLQFKEEVMEKCKGLPLSIVVLGGILRRRKDSDQWKNVLDHISVNPRTEEYELLQSILSLSYDDLPSHLKPCFMYVAVYPEDYEIEAIRLKWMWIAEGFISQQQGYTMEDLAEDYLEELIQRSLLRLVKRDKLGRVSVIRVHDLVLDMARSEAQEVNFLHQNIQQQSSIVVRRLSLHDHIDVSKSFNNLAAHKLRSLIIHPSQSQFEFPLKYLNFHSTNFLRVLSLRRIYFWSGEFQRAICNLIQLRYLCFAGSRLSELPYNISNLQNLQTLDISDTEVRELPKKFWEIPSLRHVIGGPRFEISPPSEQDLSELQTLIGGKVNYEWIKNDGLRKLTNIRTLSMKDVVALERQYKELEEKVIDAVENLKHLTKLHLELELASMNILTTSNTSLQYLKLTSGRYSRGDKNPVRLSNLHTLHISHTSLGQDDIDMIGSMPKLKSLKIAHTDELMSLMFKECHFSSLKQLKLSCCPMLFSWEVNEDWLKSTSFHRVQIKRCPRLSSLPQELRVKEIRLGRFTSDTDDEEVLLSDKVRLWAEQMAESPTKTVIIQEE